MSEQTHTAEVVVGAAPEQVWQAITDPAFTRRYVFACDIEGEWTPGAPWRYQSAGRVAIDGTVVEADPPRLLRLTAKDHWLPAAADDPPYRIEWQVEPLGGGRSLVRLTHSDLVPGGAADQGRDEVVELLLRGLRTVVDPEAAAELQRLDAIGAVEVRPLTAERRDDFLDLFDNRAFADNPGWAGCYCFNFRFAGSEEEAAARTGAENRRDMSAAIGEGRAHGLLAYAGGRAVGWCSASPKAEMVQLLTRDWMPAETDRVGIIGCLVVAPQYRRHGVARALIDAATAYLTGLGCTVAEAYPLREVDADAHGFYGPLPVYTALGYETFRELPGRLVVRKTLGA